MRRAHIFLILWILLLVALSFIPGRDDPQKTFGLDKILHAAVFAYLGYLAFLSLGWLGALLALLFAMANEFQQFLVRGREVAFLDFVANGVGVTLGSLVGFWRSRRALSAG